MGREWRQCPGCQEGSWALRLPPSTHSDGLPALKPRPSQSPKSRDALSQARSGPCWPLKVSLALPALPSSVSWQDCRFLGQGWSPVELCPRAQPSIRALQTVVEPASCSLPTSLRIFVSGLLPLPLSSGFLSLSVHLCPSLCLPLGLYFFFCVSFPASVRLSPFATPLCVCLTHASSLVSEQAA